ncbi:MAG TPA: response regulator [Bryobacteraceae bacterium]|nr:response regulator [Bryobacteraceae bacterium]
MARILVVDDDAAQLELRCQLLGLGGHTTVPAFSPSEAMRQIASSDLVMMDLRFPNAQGKDDPAEGLALIRRIRESGQRVPIIVVSGWPEYLEGHPEAQLVSRVLAKPIGMEALLGAIADILGTQDARAAVN